MLATISFIVMFMVFCVMVFTSRWNQTHAVAQRIVAFGLIAGLDAMFFAGNLHNRSLMAAMLIANLALVLPFLAKGFGRTQAELIRSHNNEWYQDDALMRR